MEYKSDKNIGYCFHHEDDIDISTFEYKGCWTCRHSYTEKLTDVSGAAEELNVSKSTIRRWIKEGKLEGRLFVKFRRTGGFNPPYEKYYIYNKSLAQFIKKREI